jgi:hypothetical protein
MFTRTYRPKQIVSTFEEDDDDTIASYDLNLFSSSSILVVVGCDLVGKLIDLIP